MNEPVKQTHDFSVEVSSEPSELASADVQVRNVESLKFAPCQSETADASSVRVNLQSSGLAFQIETQIPHSAQIVELTARLEVLVLQAAEAQRRLEQAWQHIGFLEAQVQQRDQIIDQLCKDRSL